MTTTDEITLGGRDMPECICDVADCCPLYAWLDDEACVEAIVAFLLWGAR